MERRLINSTLLFSHDFVVKVETSWQSVEARRPIGTHARIEGGMVAHDFLKQHFRQLVEKPRRGPIALKDPDWDIMARFILQELHALMNTQRKERDWLLRAILRIYCYKAEWYLKRSCDFSRQFKLTRSVWQYGLVKVASLFGHDSGYKWLQHEAGGSAA